MAYKPFKVTGSKWTGYTDDPQNADVQKLSQPSLNALITKNGEAKTRGGYLDTGIDLGEANFAARPFHVPHFNITFFAVNTSVYYYDHNVGTLYNTSVSITAGTKSCFEEHNGVVYITNQTDGCFAFLLTRLNGAVSAGAATITTDVEGGAQANVFDTELSPAAKYLTIQGNLEEYSGAANTGVFTLSGTASTNYPDNTVAIVEYDLTARFPKCAKIVAWKDSLNFIGLSPDTGNAFSSDRRVTTLGFTQFANAQTSENILKITGGTSGTELVGRSGALINAIATRDYLYLFKEHETYYISVADVNQSTGARPPQLLSSNYGCLNTDCAVDMGNGEVAFETQNNRCIRIKISSDNGAPVVFPDESFDNAYSNTNRLLSSDQTGALLHYDKPNKRLYRQVIVDGQRLTLPFNNEIRDWEPPWSGFFFGGFFERNGITYAVDANDDTVYEIGYSLDDDGTPIECVMASPIIEFEDGRVSCKWKEIEISGSMTNNAEIAVQRIVGQGTPQTETFDSHGVNFADAPALGGLSLGETSLGGHIPNSEMGTYDKRFAVFPSLGSDFQIILSSNGEGHSFTWSSYSIVAAALTKSALTLK